MPGERGSSQFAPHRVLPSDAPVAFVCCNLRSAATVRESLRGCRGAAELDCSYVCYEDGDFPDVDGDDEAGDDDDGGGMLTSPDLMRLLLEHIRSDESLRYCTSSPSCSANYHVNISLLYT